MACVGRMQGPGSRASRVCVPKPELGNEWKRLECHQKWWRSLRGVEDCSIIFERISCSIRGIGRTIGMAHFTRQKRQSRFYWAELGFMALGLLGLQPGLFTHLIFGSPSRPSSYDDSHYQAFSNQALSQIQELDHYRDWPQTYLASYHPTQQISPGQFSHPSTYAQPQQQLYAQLPAYPGTAAYPHQQNYSPQSANYHQQLQYAQSMPPIAAAGWQNQATYVAQSNNGYTQPSLAASGYQPTATYPPSSYPNAFTSAYNGSATRATQQPLFDTSTNSTYNTGTAKASSSALNYPYQPNTANTSTWQRYRAPTPPIYR